MRQGIKAALKKIRAGKNRDFVAMVYRAILGREPDASGLNTYTDLLSSGRSKEEVMRDLLNSEEFKQKASDEVKRSKAFNRDFVAMLYQTLLKREGDPGGLSTYTDLLTSSHTQSDILEGFIKSEEFMRCYIPTLDGRFGDDTDRLVLELLQSNRRLHAIHEARSNLIKTLLPPAKRILDLGGAAAFDNRGALLIMGYPHKPEEIVIVDLPPGMRVASATPEKSLKPVKSFEHQEIKISYHFQSMADLSNFPADSFDLVWSGESIEHVPIEVAEDTFKAVKRVLKPGGIFALDTPNRRITKLHVGESNYTHPEHFTEYYLEEILEMGKRNGLTLKRTKGLIEMRESLERNKFLPQEFLQHVSINDRPEESYVFYAEFTKEA